jgi:hypothetical protein
MIINKRFIDGKKNGCGAEWNPANTMEGQLV